MIHALFNVTREDALSIHKTNLQNQYVVLDEQLMHYVFIGSLVQCKAFIASC